MKRRSFAALAAMLATTIASTSSGADPLLKNSLMFFGGWATNEDWGRIVTQPWDIEFSDAQLLGIAYSREVWRFSDGMSFELEAQAVRHFTDQDNWEFNLPVGVARWRPFSSLDASAAFGLGLSIATETPRLEVIQEGDSAPIMAYWTIELETATPIQNLQLVGRIHHRSTAYGLFGEDGGLNSLVIGLRRRF